MRKRIAVWMLSIAGVFGVWGTSAGVYASQDAGENIDDIIQEVESVEELSDAMDSAGMITVDDVCSDSDDDEAGEFALQRVMLFADEVTETYGAADIILYEKYNYYVFSFDSVADTKNAYEQMCEDYGPENCTPDRVFEADEILADVDTDTYEAVSWGCTYMGMDKLKTESSEYNVADIRVAVIDSGVSTANSLFNGRIDTTRSRNIYDNNSSYGDTIGHGSHVAGIIADCTPSNVQLVILKSFSNAGNTSSEVIQNAIMAALDAGVDVVNMSMCFYGSNANDKVRDAIEPLLVKADEEKVIICAAAGNANAESDNEITDVSGNSYPADSEGVITVSALKKKADYSGTSEMISTDTVEFDSSYSFYGAEVDFCAPGTAIKSAYRNGRYATLKGTSMATPHITAAVAYAKMVNPDLRKAEVVELLRNYCVDLGTEDKDMYYGYGCPYMADFFTRSYPNACNVTAAVNTKKGISVTWSEVAKASSYRIYRKTASEGYRLIRTISGNAATTYVDTTAAAGTRYRYAVRAVRGGELGTSLGTVATVRLGQPDFTVKNVSSGLQISWKSITGAQGYKVYRKGSGETRWSLCRNVSSGTTSVTDTGVSHSKPYIYTVRAYRSYVYSSFASPGTKIYRLKAAVISSVKSDVSAGAVVRWKKSDGVTGYQIQYSTDSGYKSYKVATINKMDLTKRRLNKLTSKKRYYMRIRTYKIINGKTYYSAWSSSTSVVVK